jgi:ElaB/YqjD/DUF883 family membrane-anchored ribosome-binding protein
MRKVADGKAPKWSLTGTAGRVTDKAKGAVQSAEDVVRRKPWHVAGLTALVAAGTAFLTARASGRVLRGKSR